MCESFFLSSIHLCLCARYRLLGAIEYGHISAFKAALKLVCLFVCFLRSFYLNRDFQCSDTGLKCQRFALHLSSEAQKAYVPSKCSQNKR